MKKYILTFLILLFVTGALLFNGALLHCQSPATGILEIEFTGIRSDEGQIAIGLNRSPDGWPREPEIELAWPKEDLKNGTMVVRIDTLEYGTYAISVLDDLDFDEEMKFFLGIPREGFGFSRNPPHKLSEPDFEESAIKVDRPFQRISIEMRYFAKGGRNPH
jgi:uncharacterized protein (DUF2141 family)